MAEPKKKHECSGERLIRKVREELNRYRGAWPELSRRTGLPIRWIRGFAWERCPDASFIRVVTVARYLGVPLDPKSEAETVAVKRRRELELLDLRDLNPRPPKDEARLPHYK